MSQRDVQRIGKKAVIDAMQSKWHMQRMPESGNAVFSENIHIKRCCKPDA